MTMRSVRSVFPSSLNNSFVRDTIPDEIEPRGLVVGLG